MNKQLLLSFTMCGIMGMGPKLHAQSTNYAPDVKLVPGSTAGMSFRGLFTPDLFNGTMQVSVPIYSYNHDGNNYGISLTYDTKGVPVDAISSPEGLNWNLVAPASIVRIIKDLPDELINSEDSLIAGNLPNAERYVLGKFASYAETAQQKARPNVYRDGEADEFIVTLNGSSFKFYIGPNNQFFTVPHRNVNIELLANGSKITRTVGEPIHWTSGFQFHITDEKGNKFYFVEGEQEGYYLNQFADWQQVDLDEFSARTVSWELEKVILADGEEIDYSYGSTNFHIYYGLSYNAYRNDFVKENRSGSTYSAGGANSIDIGEGEPYRHYLTKIVYPNGVTADLEYAADSSRSSINGTPLLNRIKLSSQDNSINYDFIQSRIKGRWFLDSIKMVSGSGNYQEPYYSFEYSQTNLPERLSIAQDFYGYYNGDPSCVSPTGNSYDKITTPKHAGINYGNNRSYNASFAQAGLLTKITNAYGGEQDYYYGPNLCSNVLGSIIPTGDGDMLGLNAVDGVRIDSVIQKDRYHPGSKKTIKFSYSNGQLFLPGGRFYYPYYIDSTTNKWGQVMYQSMFISSHQLVKGANHGYSNVSIKTYGLNNKLLSRRDVSFTNMKDATSNNIPRYYKVSGSKNYFEFPYTNKQYVKDWEIGLPLTITDYDQNNRIVTKTINQYQFTSIDSSAKQYLLNTRTAKVNSGHQQKFPGKQTLTEWYPYKKTISDTYFPFTGTANLARSITEGYASDQKKIVDTTWYNYDTHNNLSSVISRNSKGQRIGKLIVYNYDVDGTNVNFNNPGTTLYNMTNAGLEKVVSTETWQLNNTSGLDFSSNDLLLNADITVFQYQSGKLWEKGALKTDIGSPMSYFQYTGLSQSSTAHSRYEKILTAYNTSDLDTGFQRLSEVTLFDSIGDPLEVHSFGQNNYSALIWDRLTGHCLAIVTNSRYKDIAYTGFESDYYPYTLYNNVDEGNFVFNSSNIIDLPILNVNGQPNKSYLLKTNIAGSVINNDLRGSQALSVGTPYMLSFWYYGQKPTIKIGAQVIPIPDSCLVTAVGYWKNMVIHFTPTVTGSFRFTNAGSGTTYLDEVRLCPQDASMQSWTYAPLFGVNSETDAGNHVIRYGFDKMGRKTIKRDREFRILSAGKYHIAH